ncbi:hypothetical protein GCK32_002169, partial [Trichostrongylus colubriformis]
VYRLQIHRARYMNLTARCSCKKVFSRTSPCHISEKPNASNYNAHLLHSTALLLSIFLGFLGIDRMYLGYYAVGRFDGATHYSVHTT